MRISDWSSDVCSSDLEKLSAQYAAKRSKLKAAIKNKDASPEERFEAVLKLAELPRNSAKIRVRNRCEITGRPRAVYRKLKLSRNMLRELASMGQIDRKSTRLNSSH